mgnify:CR=1 FL=1
MDDKPEYRWLVANNCYEHGIWSDPAVFRKHNAAIVAISELISEANEVNLSGLKIYLIDLHKLEPVAVTGSDG